MYCPYCGSKIPNDASFCPVCGNNIASYHNDKSPNNYNAECYTFNISNILNS